MRGVVSAAMLNALEDLGLPSTSFDAIYAASAGAINCAYYIGGNTWYPLSIYFDDLNTRKFVDLRRLLSGDALNLSYALDEVVTKVKPLNVTALLESPVPLHISVTNVDKIRTETISEFSSTDEFIAALRASMWLPVAIRGTTRFRDFRAVDGGVLTPHPFQLALNDGCSHVLSLSTRPIKPPISGTSLMQRYVCRHLERLQRGLGNSYLAAIKQYRIDRHELQKRMLDPGGPPYVLDLAPLPGTAEVKRHELRFGPLLTGARGGYEVMCCAIDAIDPSTLLSGRAQAVPRFTFVSRGNGVNHFDVTDSRSTTRVSEANRQSKPVDNTVELDG